MSQPRTCPACGLRSRPPADANVYDQCFACGWDYDPVRLAFPGAAVAGYDDSLAEHQRHLRLAPLPNAADFERDTAWRPLAPWEALDPLPPDALAYYDALVRPLTPYWIRVPTVKLDLALWHTAEALRAGLIARAEAEAWLRALFPRLTDAHIQTLLAHAMFETR